MDIGELVVDAMYLSLRLFVSLNQDVGCQCDSYR